MDTPFVITIFGKDFSRKGVVGNPVFAEFFPELNGLGTGTLELAATDPMREYLDTPGARFRVEYRGEHLMSGRVDEYGGKLTVGGNVRYDLVDEWRWMQNTLAWVVPIELPRSSGELEPIDLDDDAQSFSYDLGDPGVADGSGYFVWPDGSGTWGGLLVDYSESAIKQLVRLNAVLRLGRPITIATDLERGGDARTAEELPTEIRFDTLEDALADLIEWSDLVVQLWHDGETATVNLDVAEPVTWPAELTVESGIVSDGDWNLSAPTATRIVVGGPGQNNARMFAGTSNATLEATYADVIEVFRDATGISLTWPDALADNLRVAKYFFLEPTVDSGEQANVRRYLNRALAAGLFAGVNRSGISMQLSETEQFHFHGTDGIHLGDFVTVRLNGVAFTERIRGARLTFSTNGFEVVPRVGDRVDDPLTSLAKAVRRVATAQRRISASK